MRDFSDRAVGITGGDGDDEFDGRTFMAALATLGAQETSS